MISEQNPAPADGPETVPAAGKDIEQAATGLAPGALTGIRVLDLGQIYNGPYCTLLLSYLGAEVVKVEPHAGEPTRWRSQHVSHPFLMLNSNKQGITVNLKDPRGREIFLDLARTSDIIVENFATGVMDRLGLGYDVLAEVNPRLIVASGKGFGSTGPYATRPAMDLTVQAMTGVMAATGFPDNPPVKAGVAVSDFMGGIHLLAAVLAALYQRERTGRGQFVEVAMQDAIIPALASNLGGLFESGGAIPERTGNRHGGLAMCPYNVYPTKDDGWVAIFCVTTRHWQSLCALMARPDLGDDMSLLATPSRVARMDEIDNIVAGWSGNLTRAECVEQLLAESVPAAPVNRVADLIDDEHVRARGMLRTLEHPTAGTVTVFGTPLRLSDSPIPAPQPAPDLGQHTFEVLAARLGLDHDQLTELRAAGVI